LPTTYTSRVSAGGLAIVKNSLALHPKMKRTMNERNDRPRDLEPEVPWIGTPASSFERRRYLIAKYTTRPEMSSVKNAVSATRRNRGHPPGAPWWKPASARIWV